MTRTKAYSTIWQDHFDPEPVRIPQTLYHAFIPCADVVPCPVYDEFVIETDAVFQEVIGRAFQRINAIVASVPPLGIQISLRHLIEQIPSILSGSQRVLRVFANRRLVKTIPVDTALTGSSRAIQKALLERLLLFEDLQSILTSEEVDRWAETFLGEAVRATVHMFRRGAKIAVLMSLLQAGIKRSNNIVVFVRNIPVCEAVTGIIIEAGIRAVFIHGNVDEAARSARLEDFRNGNSSVLVVTRQLFGRGFDIPQAHMAIFYSPKENERTMWQEMLRIRGTIRRPKTVFLLFYAWTSETQKMLRLLGGMLRTNATWISDRFRWIYSEVESARSEHDTQAADTTIGRSDRDRSSATKDFVGSILSNIEGFLTQHATQIVHALTKLADRAGFLHAWPNELVRVLIYELGATIEGLATTKKDGTEHSIKKALAKLLHPDRHPNATGLEKRFWHELFVALQM